LPGHSHSGTTNDTNTDHSHGYYKYAPSADSAGNPVKFGVGANGPYLNMWAQREDIVGSTNIGANSFPNNISTNNGTSGNMNSNTSHSHTFTTNNGNDLNSTPINVLPPFICVHYIIKY
jgi:hypothetical protein